MEQSHNITKKTNGKDKNHSQRDVLGIHHVTAITSDPQRNIDFYTDILGLRFVKLTVNQDDPTSYHLYYGDELGHPGTILTFFHWPNIPKGHRGTGEVSAVAFLITENSINYWMDRFKDKKIEFRGPYKRFENERVITFHDPDGLDLELVAHNSAENRTANIWKEGPIPIEHAIRGFYSVTLSEEGYERTASVLMDELGFVPTRQDGGRFRYEIPTISSSSSNQQKEEENIGGANIVDVLCLPHTWQAAIGIGSVHHVAWRTPTDQQQKVLRKNIVQAGLNAIPVIDRVYFHSVYFREPGGVLFEIATNPPGFLIDEKAKDLGTHIMLPPWLESMRNELEKVLLQIHLPMKEKVRGQVLNRE
ncbi:MAG: VOC family protein [Nitrososphaeraceae archaeon]